MADDLDLDTKHYWKVVAKDAKGAMTEGIIASFTTDFPKALLKKFT